mmetsp:Transcript_57189/g.100071  ORF Transcript_57189/g.100071 Transcript_57189/m.100071 type:complete len:532 (+) Transcript_57189:94-1689(+)
MAPGKRLDEITLEDIDFEAVKECNDKNFLKRYLKLLQDDGNYFEDLVKACKAKLLEVSPKDYYLLFPRVASNQEVEEITKDLLDWQESVKETDNALRRERKNKIWDDESKIFAPIRGQEAMVARPNIQRLEEPTRRKKEPALTNDAYARDKTRMKDYYDAWDRVDVDAIEAEMEEEERAEEESRRKHFDELREEQEEAHRSTPIDVGKLPEGVPTAHRRHMADSEKEKGNEAFYAKDFEEAEAYYSRSLHFRADDPSTWANRALARLKLERPQAALQDCEHALALNSKYMKALHRKGKALYDLKRYDEAVHAFQLALVESPGNTQINGDLMVARRKQKDAPASSPPASFAPPARAKPPRPDDDSTCIIEEITDEADAGPAAGYTRVQIEEDSDSEDEDKDAGAAARTGGTGAVAGFHKVQIQEASDDEEDEEVVITPAKKLPEAAPASGFHKVQIQEEDEDSEEAEPMPEPVAAPAAAVATGTGMAGFHKVQIVEASESDDEAPAPMTARGAPASPAAAEASSGISFDDMD